MVFALPGVIMPRFVSTFPFPAPILETLRTGIFPAATVLDFPAAARIPTKLYFYLHQPSYTFFRTHSRILIFSYTEIIFFTVQIIFFLSFRSSENIFARFFFFILTVFK